MQNLKLLLPVVAAFLTAISPARADAPKTANEGVETLRRTWTESLAKTLAASPYFGQLKEQLFQHGRVGARSISSEECYKLITRTLSEREKKSNLLAGSLDDLKPNREVWAITNVGEWANGFEAYLDPKDGRLLLLWIIPEG